MGNGGDDDTSARYGKARPAMHPEGEFWQSADSHWRAEGARLVCRESVKKRAILLTEDDVDFAVLADRSLRLQSAAKSAREDFDGRRNQGHGEDEEGTNKLGKHGSENSRVLAVCEIDSRQVCEGREGGNERFPRLGM